VFASFQANRQVGVAADRRLRARHRRVRTPRSVQACRQRLEPISRLDLLASVFARTGRQLGGGIIAGNTLIMLLAWRADSLTAELLVSSAITSVIMAAVGALACFGPARRALRIQPTEARTAIQVVSRRGGDCRLRRGGKLAAR
jgi:hypothetical protein